jgi:hypothetical protein
MISAANYCAARKSMPRDVRRLSRKLRGNCFTTLVHRPCLAARRYPRLTQSTGALFVLRDQSRHCGVVPSGLKPPIWLRAPQRA